MAQILKMLRFSIEILGYFQFLNVLSTEKENKTKEDTSTNRPVHASTDRFFFPSFIDVIVLK